jgi:hypothetical protein
LQRMLSLLATLDRANTRSNDANRQGTYEQN